MRLEDYLKTLDKNTTVSLGAVKGTNYFYIGTVGELQKNLSTMSKELFANLYRTYEESYMYMLSAAKDFLETENEKIYYVTKKKETEEARQTFDHLHKTNKRFQAARNRIREFKPLKDREVVKVFDSAVEANLRIHIEGNEYGTMWTSKDVKGA